MPLDALSTTVYTELRRIAARQLRRERPGHTLQPAALVNEVYLRLQAQRQEFHDKAEVCGVAAGLMRMVLVDYARRRKAAGRAVDAHIELSTDEKIAPPAVELLVLDDALTRLGAIDPALLRVVELRFFGGLSVEEAARSMHTSPATVKRNWAFAKAWLYRELG